VNREEEITGISIEESIIDDARFLKGRQEGESKE